MKNCPFDITVEICPLAAEDDSDQYQIRVYYNNPPPNLWKLRRDYGAMHPADIYARKTLRVFGPAGYNPLSLENPDIYRLTWEALMDRFADVFGDKGPWDTQPWRLVWTAHQHCIRRKLKAEIYKAVVDSVRNTR